jgi:hypothetical protein
LEIGAVGDMVIQEFLGHVSLLEREGTVGDSLTSKASLSSCLQPTMLLVTAKTLAATKPGELSNLHWGLTYKAFSPVTGCVLTIGCSWITGSRRTIPPFALEALACRSVTF